MPKRALITGITGQDGSYLAEFLLKRGYDVYGFYRRSSLDALRMGRIAHLVNQIKFIEGDLLDSESISNALRESRPDEIYNLAAQSFVPASWTQPISTSEITGMGVIRLLDAMKEICPRTKFYQASSSEMFGKVDEEPQNEKTSFHPRSPYGVAKVFGHNVAINYRESYRLFICSGILFNHESPRRGKQFVTRKITHSVAEIKLGLQKKPLELGNLNSLRDWGFAGDYVEAMWLMLQQEKPDDYVIATGEKHSIKEFVTLAFKYAGMDIRWEGSGLNETAKYNGKVIVKVSPKFIRPAEVDKLQGDSSKARDILGWQPKVKFHELIKMMVDYDMNRLKFLKQKFGNKLPLGFNI